MSFRLEILPTLKTSDPNSFSIEALLRGAIAESLSRSRIELVRNGVAVVLREVGHRCSFWQVLSSQPIEVFVTAALPRVVRGCEIELDTGDLFDRRVAMELATVVR